MVDGVWEISYGSPHMKYALAVILLTASQANANDDLLRTRSWVEECTQEEKTCYAFAQGVIEAARTYDTEALCLPTPVDTPRIVASIMSAAKQHPEINAAKFSDVILQSLKVNFPCKAS